MTAISVEHTPSILIATMSQYVVTNYILKFSCVDAPHIAAGHLTGFSVTPPKSRDNNRHSNMMKAIASGDQSACRGFCEQCIGGDRSVCSGCLVYSTVAVSGFTSDVTRDSCTRQDNENNTTTNKPEPAWIISAPCVWKCTLCRNVSDRRHIVVLQQGLCWFQLWTAALFEEPWSS